MTLMRKQLEMDEQNDQQDQIQQERNRKKCAVHLVSFSQMPKMNGIRGLGDGKIMDVLERGDIIENIDESGYRSDGVYFFDGKEIIDQSRRIDDYGEPATEFAAPWEFTPDYWGSGEGAPSPEHTTYNWTGKEAKSKFYWHSIWPAVTLDEPTETSVKAVLGNEDELLETIAGHRCLHIQTTGHASNIFVISARELRDIAKDPDNWIYVCYYLSEGDYPELWEEAREKYPKLRTIALIGDIYGEF